MRLNIVWKATIDLIYTCRVRDIDDYWGILEIIKENEMLFSKAVQYYRKPIFGPDLDDVMDWENICIDFVDSLRNI
jgi:hypothetical protein